MNAAELAPSSPMHSSGATDIDSAMALMRAVNDW